LTLVSATALAITGSTTMAAAKQPSKAELVQRLSKAIEFNQQAEVELLKQLKIVTRWVAEFHQRYDHYPRSPQEIGLFQTQLGKLLPDNPFEIKQPKSTEEQPLLMQHRDPLNPTDSDAPRIQVMYDPSLNITALEMAKQNPPGNWFSNPGTVAIVTDGLNLCAVWIGGFDGRPLRDTTNNRTIFYVIR
jgi:hypothetical protein